MKKKNNGKKVVVVLLALVLLLGGVIGGTIAYLMDQSQTITNTFTTSNITISLTETTTDFKMVPGCEITKDPTVTVTKGSEACYLFVKVEAANGVALAGQSTAADYITYAMDTSWTELEDGVYYQLVATDADADQTFPVLAGNKVTVLTTVTEAMMTAAKTNAPTLKFTAYAVQQAKLTVAQAWDQAKDLPNKQ